MLKVNEDPELARESTGLRAYRAPDQFDAQRYHASAGYSEAEWTERMRACIASFAPKGSTIHVINRAMPDHRNLRMYSVNRGRITRIDHLMTLDLFSELLDELGHEPEKVTFYGFDKTDGSKLSGLLFPNDCYSNITRGAVFALAKVVHGDRDAWSIEYL